MANTLDEQRWAALPTAKQMANIGSEIGRSRKWLLKGNNEIAEGAFLRALDLIDLTIKYGRANTAGRSTLLKEICRARDCYTEAFLSAEQDTLEYLDKYFGQFALIA